MASGSDGSIIIDTSLDDTGFERGSDKMLKSIQGLTKDINRLGSDVAKSFSAVMRNGFSNASAVLRFKDGLDQAESKAAALRKQLAELSQAKAPTQKYEEATAALSKAESKLFSLYNRQEKMRDGGVKENSAQWQNLAYDIKNAEEEVARYERVVASLESNGEAFVDNSNTAEFRELSAQLDETNRKIQEGRSLIDAEAISQAQLNVQAAQEAVIRAGNEEERREALSQLSAAQAELNAVTRESIDGAPEDTEEKISAWQEFAAALSGVKDRITEAYQHEGLLAAGAQVLREALGGVLLPVYGLSQALNSVGDQLLQTGAHAMQTGTALGVASGSLQIISGLFVKAASGAVRLTASLAELVGNAIISGLQRLAQAAKNAAKSLAQLAAQKLSEISKGGKQATLASNGLVKALTSVKTMLKSRIKRMFITYLMNEIKQSMAALVQYSATFNASVSGMRNAARGLGANLAVAFSGLVNAVAPAITTIINLLSRAISYLNAFFAALSGKSTVTVAKKQTENYANSLKKATGAAKNLKKAHKLLGFDELNILSDKKDSGAGGGAATPDLYQDVPVNKLLPEDVSAWFDSIKKAFEAGDWAGIGTAFSSGLNTAIAQVSPWLENTVQPLGVTWASRIAQILNGAVSGLDWTAVGTTLGAGINTVSATVDSFLTTFNFDNLGSGIATSLNGLFNKVNWEQLGATFGHAWQGLISTIHGFVTTADWAAIGTSIAEFVMGWFNAIDWNMLAETVSTGFIGVWTMISTALEGIDWQKIGRDLATAIGQIDWAGCAAAVFEGLGAALGALGGFLWGVFTTAWDGLTDMWSGFCESCRENGKMTISGFFKGIGEALANIGSWIVENIFTPFINGFKAAFGIHSPSTVMAEQGNFIVEGLLNGITAVWGTITGFFSGAVDGIKDILSGAWESIKTTASTAWSGITSTLGTAWNGIKEKASTTWNSIKTTASTVWGAIKTSLNDTWNNLKTTAGNTWDTIRSSASTAWESVKGAATQKWNDIKTTVVDLWDGLKSTVRESKWDDIGSNMVAGLKNGITGAWQGLKNKVGSLCNDLATKAKDTLGIKSPSKVFAEIGQYLDEGMAVGIDKGENGLLRTVRNLAGNVTNTMSDASPEVQIAGHATLAGMNNVTQALGGIADKFSAIAAVLNDMDGLKVPAIAAGTVAPYQTGLSGNGKDSLSNLMAASNEELISVIIQVANNLAGAIVSAIQQGNARPLVLDSESVTTGVINEINRRTLSSGESPLLA